MDKEKELANKGYAIIAAICIIIFLAWLIFDDSDKTQTPPQDDRYYNDEYAPECEPWTHPQTC
jgi:hypothetical protein